MNTTEGFVSVLGILLSVGLTLGVLWFIPSCMRSVFRYRLWRIRDALFDEVTAGTIPDETVIDELITRIEHLIRLSRHVTLYKFITTGIITAWDLREHERYEDAKARTLPPECRQQIARYERQVGRAMATHLYFGSPSGWIGVLFVWLTILKNGLVAGQRDPVQIVKTGSVRMGKRLSSKERIDRLGLEDPRQQTDPSMSAYAN